MSDGKKQQKSGGDSSDTLPPLCLEETHGGFSIFSVSCHVLSRSYLALARHSSRISAFCYRNLSSLSQRIAEHPAREQNTCFVEPPCRVPDFPFLIPYTETSGESI
jgi:hypothetical protein